jgi:hypothetical protein
VIWESEGLGVTTKHGGMWEKVSFCDAKGDLHHFYLDSATGETSLREPPNMATASANLEFNPGYFDKSSFPEAKKEIPRKSFVKPTTNSLKRNVKKRGSQGNLQQVHPDDTEIPEQTPGTCMFDPFSSKRTAWDLLIILPCLMYLTVMMPYRLCFVDNVSFFFLSLQQYN